jgi:hypothetical protein
VSICRTTFVIFRFATHADADFARARSVSDSSKRREERLEGATSP